MLKKSFKLVAVIVSIIVVAFVGGCNASKYEDAKRLLEEGNAAEAREIFSSLEDYEDSAGYVKDIDYAEAVALIEGGDAESSLELFSGLGGYKDSVDYIEKINEYQDADKALADGEYLQAKNAFAGLGGFYNSEERLAEASYQYAADISVTGGENALTEALEIFELLGDYKDSAAQTEAISQRILEYDYKKAVDEYQLKLKQEIRIPSAASFFSTYLKRFQSFGDYEDAAKLAAECEQYQLYFDGRYLYRAGKFTEAAEKLKATDVLNAQVLYGFVDAMIMYEAGETEEALVLAVDYLNNAYAALAADEDNAAFWYDYNGAASTMTGDAAVYLSGMRPETTPAGTEMYIADYSADAEIYMGFIEAPQLCFARVLDEYWIAQVDSGKNPAKLEKLPVTDNLEQMIYFAYNNRLKYKRANQMSVTVAEQNLGEYYDKLNAPVDITGNGIYAHGVRNEESGALYSVTVPSIGIHNRTGYAYLVADKPENARYLVCSTVSHDWDASWVFVNSNSYAGDTYHTTVRVVVKDCLTGRILFDESQKTMVPEQFHMSGNVYYATGTFDDERLDPIIEKIFNDWE